MEPDLLQQLRDIHLPAEPGWWPPAPGWWLLALLLLAGSFWLFQRLRAARARGRPLRQARVLYQQLYVNYQQGLVDAPTYLHQANELLKRLFVHGLHDHQARRANDMTWLEILDQRLGDRAFTEGPGRQLGNQRFHPAPEADPDTLHPLMQRLLREIKP